MRNSIRNVFAAACLLLAQSGTAHAGGVAWSRSLSQAMVQAKASHRLLMVDFYTDWCGYCKKMDAETYSDPGAIRSMQQVVPVKVNAEKEGLAIATRYRVHSFPTLLFINPAGEVEGKIDGYEPPVRFVQHVGSIMDFHRQVQTLPAQEAKFRNRPDLKQASRLLGVYVTLKRQQKASETLAALHSLDPRGSKGYLTSATLYVGEMYRTSERPEQAERLFQQALKTAKKPEEQGVAHMSLAFCQLARHDSKGRPLKQNILRAIPELKTVIAIPGAPDELKQQAQTILSRIEAYRQQHPGS